MPDKAYDFSIKFEGTALTAEQKLALVAAVTFEESLTETARVEIIMRETETTLLKALPLKLGMRVELSLGLWADVLPVFDGNIVKLAPKFEGDGPATLSVICYDRSYLLKKTPEPAVYKNASHADIARQIIKRNGLVPYIEPSTRLSNYKLQDDQAVVQEDDSDWKVLSELASRSNMNLLAHGDTIFLVDDEHAGGDAFHSKLRPGTVNRGYRMIYRPVDPLEDDDLVLLSFKPELGSHDQRIAVEVVGWGAIGADGKRYGKDKLGSQPKDGQNYTEVIIKTEKWETLRITGEAARTVAQAKQLAVAELEHRAARLVKGEAELVVLQPDISVGQRHLLVVRDLQPFGKMFTGPYIVEAVRHEINSDGEGKTAFDVRREGVTAA